MLVYWSFVLVPTLLALGSAGRPERRRQWLLLAPLFAALFLFMALRETGGDFTTYLQLYENLDGEPLQTFVEVVEPGYGVVNWISSRLGLGIYGVNAACAAIFLFCLFRAARNELHPLLLVTLAIPYFVIVVGVGYTRQGVAAALVMLSVVYLREQRPWRAALAILVGATFHFSAFAALALPLLGTSRHGAGFTRNLSRVLLIAVVAIASPYMFSNQLDTYMTHYIESDRYESGGAFLRSIVTGAAAVIFILRRHEFKAYSDYAIWRLFAWLGLACVPLSLVASTPVDRMGLYLIPFQLITFARLPAVFQKGRSFHAIKFLVLVSYLLYFFVWLHLGAYAEELWLPYRWIFSEG